MKERNLIFSTITNVLIILVTLFSLFITFQITAHNYKDNTRYSQAYFLMNQHHLNIPKKGIDNDMYYLVDSLENSQCIQDGNTKYYLLDKDRYPISTSDSILTDKQYNLLSCEKLSKYNTLPIVKKEKGYYIKKNRSLGALLNEYRTTIGGMEPIYIFLSYISSSVMDYNYFILFLNLAFLVVVFLALKKFTKNYKYMYIILVLTDYYFYVYQSNTHRLKLALIFFLLSYLTHNKTKILMIAASLFSHLQILIYYLYYLILTQIQNNKLSNILSKKQQYDIYMVLTFALFSFALGFVSREIISKISYYLHLNIPYKVIILVVIYLIYLYIFKLKDTIKTFIPLAIIVIGISLFIGSSRVNLMLMEFIFIIELNRVLNKQKYALLIIVPFILYSIYKSVHYIQLGLQ